MNKYTLLLVILFIELILEVGVQLESYIVKGLSFKNVLIYGLFALIYLQGINRAAYLNSTQILAVAKFFFYYIIYALAITYIASEIMNVNPRYELLPGIMAVKNELLDGLMIMIVFYYISNSRKRVAFMVRSLAIIIALASVVTVLDLLLPGISIFGFDEIETNRARGAFGEPNQTAAILALYVPFVASLALTEQRWKGVYIVGLIAVLAAIVSTGSRGGMLGAAAGVWLFLFAIRKQLTIGKKAMIILNIPLIIVLVLTVMPSSYIDFLVERFAFITDKNMNLKESSSGRSMLWEMAWNMWMESPFLGQGWGAYRNVLGLATHNVYLDYLVSTGVLGTILILFVWYRIVRVLRRAAYRYSNKAQGIVINGMLCGVVGLLVALNFVNLYKPWLFAWAFIGVSLAYANQAILERCKHLANG